MNQPNNLRAHLMREMHRLSGCRLDEAAACADIAARHLMAEFDAMYEQVILACVSPPLNMSIRQVADRLKISKSKAQRILSRARSRDGTTTARTIPSAA